MDAAALSLFGVVYVTVLAAELLGDRSLFAVGALAARYGPAPVLAGVVPAFMLKALAAVAFGHSIARLPSPLLSDVSAATFLLSAFLIWRERPASSESSSESATRSATTRTAGRGRWPAALPAAFSAVAFTEWADVGQLAAATLAARYGAPAVVWLGATTALSTKGLLAVTLGVGLRRYVPLEVVRRGAIGVCLVMSVLTVLAAEH